MRKVKISISQLWLKLVVVLVVGHDVVGAVLHISVETGEESK